MESCEEHFESFLFLILYLMGRLFFYKDPETLKEQTEIMLNIIKKNIDMNYFVKEYNEIK